MSALPNYDMWLTTDESERTPKARHSAEREPSEYGFYTGACLRWNPVTKRAEPGTFTVHMADFIGGEK